MPRFAANLSMMYTEVPFLDRFERAARSGFDAVEFLFPYPFPAAEIKARLQGNGLALALFNTPAGDWDAGERGLACLPGKDSPEVSLGKLPEFLGRRVAAPRIAVSGKIDQEERRRAAAGDAVHVGEPRLAGGGARPRHALPDQGVDQTGLADVRPPNQGHFRERLTGKSARIRGTRDEFSFDYQRAGGEGRAGRPGREDIASPLPALTALPATPAH